MPHVAMIPSIKWKRGIYKDTYGSSASKTMFAARKRLLLQQCLAILCSLVNDDAKGRLMRVQGVYQKVILRVACLSCDHAENVDLNGCKSLCCPRCLGVRSMKNNSNLDLYDWPEEDDDDDAAPDEHDLLQVDQNTPQFNEKIHRPFNWTYGATGVKTPDSRTSLLSLSEVSTSRADVFSKNPGTPLKEDLADVQWDKVNWAKFMDVARNLGIYPIYNPLLNVRNLEICHSTPVDEMHAFRLGVLLRALEVSMLHLLIAVEDLKKNGKMVLDLLKKTIFEC